MKLVIIVSLVTIITYVAFYLFIKWDTRRMNKLMLARQAAFKPNHPDANGDAFTEDAIRQLVQQPMSITQAMKLHALLVYAGCEPQITINYFEHPGRGIGSASTAHEAQELIDAYQACGAASMNNCPKCGHKFIDRLDELSHTSHPDWDKDLK